jgi:integrase
MVFSDTIRGHKIPSGLLPLCFPQKSESAMKLTQQAAENLPLNPGQTDRIAFDDSIPGFGIRVRQAKKWNGGALSNQAPSRSWVFQYRMGTQSRRMNLGLVSAVKAQAARDIAAKLHAQVTLGEDPALQKVEAKAKASDTLGALVTKYLDRQRKELRPNSLRAVTRYLGNYFAPLHRTPVANVDRKAIANVLDKIEHDAGTVSRNRARTTLSALFSWAMQEGLAESNPVIGTGVRQERKRERVLSASELRLIWNTLPANRYGAIIKLLLLTGARFNEVAQLKWTEVDFQRGVISLPGDRTKNARPHEIPMSPTVRSLLEVQPKDDGRGRVFCKPSQARCKAALDNAITKANGGPLPHWTHHDLRRTAATGMVDDVKILPHVVEAVLNHISGHKGGVAGIYNRAVYRDEKREALDRWDRHIAEVVG